MVCGNIPVVLDGAGGAGGMGVYIGEKPEQGGNMGIDKKVMDLALAAAQMEEGTTKNAVYVAGLAEALTTRLAALQAVAAAARVLVSANEGFMDTVWQAKQRGPLEKALEELDKEAGDDD